MILENTFYKITNLSDDQLLKFQIRFDAESDILKAHFPGQPIVPGACLTQISKEIIEKLEKKPIQIQEFKNLKFINTINPEQVNDTLFEVTLRQGDSSTLAQVKISSPSTLFAKIDFYYI
jgi:3-hydroxyacyl-[acyl-carrier-protein] dehydratase